MTYGLILAGLLLSVLSYYNWCSLAGCSRLHGVNIFFMSMELWGMLFFLLLAALTPLIRFFWLAALRTALLAGALGVEVTLLYIQWVLKDVCPLCLGVTAAVLALCVMEVARMRAAIRSPKPVATSLSKRNRLACQTIPAVAALVMGMLLTQPVKKEFIAGAPETVTTVQTATPAEPVPCIGKKCGYPAVRIYSDYFCPSCRRQEPVINAVVTKVGDRAKVVFCDLPTHGKISKMYIACFIACLLGGNSADHVLEARSSLFALAGEKVDAGTRLKDRLAELGVRMELDRECVNECFRAIRDLAISDGVLTTPTVVVENDAGEKCVFKGQFTEAQILSALGFDPKV
jgi:protein-disulfide isomerase